MSLHFGHQEERDLNSQQHHSPAPAAGASYFG